MIKLLVLAKKKKKIQEQQQQQTSESDAETWSLCTSKIIINSIYFCRLFL